MHDGYCLQLNSVNRIDTHATNYHLTKKNDFLLSSPCKIKLKRKLECI
jgi:hypothetical protein